MDMTKVNDESVRIPYALDAEGRLVSIQEAGRNLPYFCPLCKNPVIVRKGEIRIHHFSHKVSDVCTQETVIHKLAKLRIQQAVLAWKKDPSISAPKIIRKCLYCQKLHLQSIPNKVDRADLEVLLSDGSIADVALMVNDQPAAVIEVRVTHAVDEEKALSLPVSFIEVDGIEVVKDPFQLNPIVDNFKPYVCRECNKVLEAFMRRAKIIAEKTHLQLPESYYRYGISRCWKCKEKILVFSWPNHFPGEPDEPLIKPKPYTIKYRYSKTAETKYWINTCPFCDNSQGDHFLYNESLEPFCGIYCTDDDSNGFLFDMLQIAHYDSARFEDLKYRKKCSDDLSTSIIPEVFRRINQNPVKHQNANPKKK
jgi:hypothetical protein